MSDSEKDWWLAWRAKREAQHAPPGVPPHPRELCTDEGHDWFPQMTVCRAEMEYESAWAAYRRLHDKRPWHDGTFTDWTEKPDSGHPYHLEHGVRIWVSETDLALGGDFTRLENPFKKTEEDA